MMNHLSIQFSTPFTTTNNFVSILHPVCHRHPAKNGSRSPSQRPSIPPSIHHHLVTFPPAGTPNCAGCCNSVYPWVVATRSAERECELASALDSARCRPHGAVHSHEHSCVRSSGCGVKRREHTAVLLQALDCLSVCRLL